MDTLMKTFVLFIAPSIFVLVVITQLNALHKRIDFQRDRITELQENFMDYKVKTGYCIKRVLNKNITAFECKG